LSVGPLIEPLVDSDDETSSSLGNLALLAVGVAAGKGVAATDSVGAVGARVGAGDGGAVVGVGVGSGVGRGVGFGVGVGAGVGAITGTKQ
jgi:hypothetical protein